MSQTPEKDTWRPDERPDQPPTNYDPMDPDELNRDPIPLPPDQERTPPIPGREPESQLPTGDPPNGEPIRLA